MAIRSAIEAIGEGIFFNYIQKGWNFIKGNAPKILTDKVMDKVMGGAGLDDNRGFELSLAKSGISEDKKTMIREAVRRLEKRNPKYAENFRRIVARGRTAPIIEVPGSDGKMEKKPDPNWVDPGVEIIKDLAECQNEDELDLALLAMGVVCDAPDGTLDEVKVWAVRTAWPYLRELLDDVARKTGDAIFSIPNYINRQYDEKIMRDEERSRMTWREFLTPSVLWRWYKDQF